MHKVVFVTHEGNERLLLECSHLEDALRFVVIEHSLEVAILAKEGFPAAKIHEGIVLQSKSALAPDGRGRWEIWS